MKGCFALVLHTHMPYVRKNGVFPVGEDWLYRAISETYLPILEALLNLKSEGVYRCLALTLTPVLLEQLSDEYTKERFVEYLNTMISRAGSDVRDFKHLKDGYREALARDYLEAYRERLAWYVEIGGDITGALSTLEREGVIEIISSCATHAFLPGLGDWNCVRRQVLLGLDSHRRLTGKNPAGFWIPECAYTRGLEELLSSEGVEYILIDPSSIPGRSSTAVYLVGESDVSALSRSHRAHVNVWDEKVGYPTDGVYLDTSKYYLQSGLNYWRVTGLDVPIEKKDLYSPAKAAERAALHARHFIDSVSGEVDEASSRGEALPLVLASYDTELFGHGWREGINWIELTLRSLRDHDSIRLTLPREYIAGNRPVDSVSLSETSWGAGNDYSTWINPDTRWMWSELRSAEHVLEELAAKFRGNPNPLAARALSQAIREVLILEASDWQYMVAKNRARKYATQRFDAHLERFRAIAGGLENKCEELLDTVSEIEELDNIFQEIDLEHITGANPSF